MPLAVYEGDIKIYNQFIKKSGKSPLNISNYYSKNSPRTIADLVLFQKALDAGGMNSKIKLVQGANNLRNKKNIEAGLAVAFAQDTWESVAKEDFYIAGPIIRKEDFVKLFYVKKSTASKYKINSLDGLRTLKGITVEGWHKDREVLDKLGLNYITAPNWKLMWSMLERGRADYLFLEPCCDYERQNKAWSYSDPHKRHQSIVYGAPVVPGLQKASHGPSKCTMP